MAASSTPRFGRMRCVICNRVIPWTWLSREPKKAKISMDVDGLLVACLDHEKPNEPQADGAT